MAGTGPLTQDWEPIVLRKKAPTAAAKKDEKAVNAARRSGADIESVKKSNAGTNKAASSGTSLNTRKLDEETENLTHEKVPMELKKNIMQARTDKKFTQAQLAQAVTSYLRLGRKVFSFRFDFEILRGDEHTQLINEKPQVIQEYECGKAIPNQQIITKLERVLGVKLRGKK